MGVTHILKHLGPAAALLALYISAEAPGACAANSGDPANTAVADLQDTSTDFLSDDAWRALSHEQRRERSRRSMIARYEPTGAAPSLNRLDQYIDKFADMTVYDPRYYLFKVKATPIAGTTGSVTLTGEVYPGHYKGGIADALQSLGFNIAENNIRILPDDPSSYGISTTSAATLRKEPRARAEQLNSVALGGWIRVLRTAEPSDLTTSSQGGRHAPGAEHLPADSPSDWLLAQSMEGYLGFVRKADFIFKKDYALPDGILKYPVQITGEGTTLPAGIFVYGSPDAGWHLYSGEKMPADAKITDLRPNFTAQQIEKLMQPFMDTKYVWGGVTDEGIDCSGFSQFFMRSAGVMLPRDAVQQATGGLIVAWGSDVVKKALPGDLVFFASENGRISHVAISLGNGRIIHSAGPGVHESRLEEPRHENDDETYSDGIMFARRMLAR